MPNLRDLGGYKTSDGATVASGLLYRSNQLHNISASDMKKLADLNLKYVYDLRTYDEMSPGRKNCRRMSAMFGWTCWPTPLRQVPPCLRS